jgi:hypothetical protein
VNAERVFILLGLLLFFVSMFDTIGHGDIIAPTLSQTSLGNSEGIISHMVKLAGLLVTISELHSSGIDVCWNALFHLLIF